MAQRLIDHLYDLLQMLGSMPRPSRAFTSTDINRLRALLVELVSVLASWARSLGDVLRDRLPVEVTDLLADLELGLALIGMSPSFSQERETNGEKR